MNWLIGLSLGFAIGGFTIGSLVGDRVNLCVEEHARPCVIIQTWAGASVLPTPPSEKEK